MEELLVLLIQLLVEFFFEVLCYGGLDFLSYKATKSGEEGCGCGWNFIFLLAGGAIGFAINTIHPRVVLPWPWLRIAALILAPIAAGFIAEAFSKWRNKSGASLDP